MQYYEESAYLTEFLARFQERTAKNYRQYISYLCITCEKPFEQITKEDAATHFALLRSRQENGTISYKTVRVRLSVYNQYALFLTSYLDDYENPFSTIPFKKVPVDVPISSIPSLKEMDAILEQAKSSPMYYLILSLAFRVSLTASDIIRLKKRHIHWEEEVCILSLQGPNERYIRLPSDVASLLKAYVEQVPGEILFMNKWGNPLTLRNLDAGIASLIKPLGLSYTIRNFRSMGILEMVRTAGQDSAAVTQYAGVSGLRIQQFANAVSDILACPAEYTNIKVVNPIEVD